MSSLIVAHDYGQHASHATRSIINRYYDPSTGQFMSIDPDVATTDQPYVFTNDDPLNFEDPTGDHCLSFACLLNDVVANLKAAGDALAIISVTAVAIGTDDEGGGYAADEQILKSSDSTSSAVATSDGLSDATLERIETTYKNIEDGNLKYSQDGTVFENREGQLPQEKPGFYTEYTVENVGTTGRGAERLVIGENGDVYYTSDHYQTFVKIDGLGR